MQLYPRDTICDVPPLSVFRAFFNPWQQAQHDARKAWQKSFAQSKEVALIDAQQNGFDWHGSISQQRQNTGTVDEQVLSQTFGPDAFEDEIISL